MLTTSELKQVKHYLDLYSKKDSQLNNVGEYTPDAEDYLSIVKDGQNVIVSIEQLENTFLKTFLDDPAYEETWQGAIDTPKLDNGAITTEKIALGAVTTEKIHDEAVTTEKIYDQAVTGIKIKDGTIENDKIANGAIDTNKLTGTISTDKIKNDAITEDKIQNNAVTTDKIRDGQVTTDKIKDENITTVKIEDYAVTTFKLEDYSSESLTPTGITTNKIADNAVTEIKIHNDAVTTNKLHDDAVTEDKILNGNVTTAKLGNGAVTTAKLAPEAVTTAKLESYTVEGTGITSAKLADGAVTEDKLADGAVTTAKLDDGLISEIQNITDATPTAGSVKPVQSGGVQNELALGAVYDVSAKNPTAGPNNNGKWESLSALLSDANLNTLIPTAVRKGGMSIKFVQSSDNKYVQFRLMHSLDNESTKVADFTNTANWQGVDEEPKNNDNLVKGRGVFNNLSKVCRLFKVLTIDAFRNEAVERLTDSYVNWKFTSSDFTSTSTRQSLYFIKIFKGERLRIKINKATEFGIVYQLQTVLLNRIVSSSDERSIFTSNWIVSPNELDIIIEIPSNYTAQDYAYVNISFKKGDDLYFSVNDLLANAFTSFYMELGNILLGSNDIDNSVVKTSNQTFTDTEKNIVKNNLGLVVDPSLNIQSNNSISNAAVTSKFQEVDGEIIKNKYSLLYKQTCNEYNTNSRVAYIFPVVDGIKNYTIKFENVVLPSGGHLCILLMNTTSYVYFPYSANVVRNITRFIDSDTVKSITLKDEELSTVKSIAVGLWEAQTDSPQPTCSFNVSIFNNESGYNSIAIRENERLIDEISNSYKLVNNQLFDTEHNINNNRVACFIPLVSGVTKYLVIVDNIYASNNSRILVSLRRGKYSSDSAIRGNRIFISGTHGYCFVEDDGTTDATCLGVVQYKVDTAEDRSCHFNVSAFAFNGHNSISDLLNSLYDIEYLKGLFPVPSSFIGDKAISEEKLEDALKFKIEYYKIYSGTTNTYQSDNRVRTNIPTIGTNKYHLDITDLVGVGNGNPIDVILMNTSSMSYWGSNYIVRDLGTLYGNQDIHLDIELSDEELASVKGIGIGMRNSLSNRPELSFTATLYRNDDNTILKQVRLNESKSKENEGNIGNLNNLETENKNSVVEAINEMMENGISPKDDIPWNDEVYLASMGLFIRIYNPYKDKGLNVYMGQLHSHAQDMSYADFFIRHKNNGYSFIASLDYDRVRKVKSFPAEADVPSDFLVLCDGYEANCGAGPGQNGEHIITLNTKDIIGFDDLTNQSFPTPDSVASVKSILVENGCVAQLAHPYWKPLFQTPEKLATLKNDLRFIEIYSGLIEYHVNVLGDDWMMDGYEWDYALDVLLSQGNFVFGTAVSDIHADSASSLSSTIIKMGAVKVYANSLSRGEIFNALLSGKYYSVSHTTKSLQDITFSSDGLFQVNVGEANATVEFIGKDAEVLSTVVTTSESMIASYQLVGTEMYVRARITFSDGKFAWTQAIMLDNKIL